MSLIVDLTEISRMCVLMANKAMEQQKIYFDIINGVVSLHQQYRLANQYVISDELRRLANSVGIQIIQGTAGYKYEDIPEALKGRQINDVWRLK